MAEQPADGPAQPWCLAPDLRARLMQLLNAEIGAACDAAVMAGADLGDLGAIVGERIRAVESLAPADFEADLDVLPDVEQDDR